MGSASEAFKGNLWHNRMTVLPNSISSAFLKRFHEVQCFSCQNHCCIAVLPSRLLSRFRVFVSWGARPSCCLVAITTSLLFDQPISEGDLFDTHPRGKRCQVTIYHETGFEYQSLGDVLQGQTHHSDIASGWDTDSFLGQFYVFSPESML